MSIEDEARAASDAIYEEKQGTPFITDMEEAIKHYTEQAEAYNRGNEVPSFSDLAQDVNPLSQRQLDNMSEKDRNKYIEDTIQILRDKAVEENREISFTIIDKDGNPKQWTIKPATLSTDKENMFNDGDDEANFGVRNLKTGEKKQSTQKEMTKSAQLSKEIERAAIRAALQAPGKIKEKFKRGIDESTRDAISNFGR